MKDYYAILRVSPSANQQTIKRSYRLLVQQFHPDVNPDPRAIEIIKEINEAYEVLGDPDKKSEYDLRLINPYPSQTQPQSTQPQTSPLRQRDPYFKKRGFRPINTRPTQYDLVVRYFHYVRKISITGLFVCFVLLVDYSLPFRHTVVNSHVENGYAKDYLVVSSGKRIAVMWDELLPFRETNRVELIESALLRKTIEVRGIDIPERIVTLGTVYGTFKFVPIIVFITAMICLFMPNNVEFRFGLCVLTGFTLFFTLLLMYI